MFFVGVKLKQPKLKRFAVPSQCLPKKSFAKEAPSDVREKRLWKRQSRTEEIERTTAISNIKLCEVPDLDTNAGFEESTRTFEELTEQEKLVVQSLLDLGSGSCSKTLVDKDVQVKSGDILCTFTSTIKEVSQLNSLTGIHSFELLQSLTLLISKYYPDIKQHKVSVRDRIILVFMKLKMAMKFNILSFLFKISAPTCKRIFIEYVHYLSNILKSCIHWPSAEECQQNMPSCFSSFTDVRVVLDCFEIPIEKPKCLCCRIRTYSHYKGRQTIKIMTGVSPAGLITFVSKSYGGRSSDKAIFVQSKLINKLEPRKDSLMVDKGFLIEDICRDYFIKVIRPYFLKKKKQFSESESKKNILISKARVHIERVNQRIKIFSILNTPMANSIIPLIDDIIVIICAMVNLQAPILAESRF